MTCEIKINQYSVMNYELIYNNDKKDVTVPKNGFTEDLLKEATIMTKIDISRIRLYYNYKGKRIPLQAHQQLNVTPSQSFTVVDSGPQFSFMVNDLFEYIPPIFIWFGILSLFHSVLTEYIQISTVMWVLHYAKRSFEAVFVHTYSQKTLPIFSILDNSCFKNCIYYWCFAFMISISVCERADYVSKYPLTQNAGISIWLFSELLNGYCHLRLRQLRPKGSLDHYLPTGFLFNSITAPNYTFEILSWLGFALFTQTWISFVFPIVGGVQMFYWADEKRKKLGARYPQVLKRGRITPFTFL